MDFLDRINENETLEPFLEPDHVSADFAKWQEQLVEVDDGPVDPIYLKRGERIIQPFCVASTFTNPPTYDDPFGYIVCIN